jgi:hypothetical protein
VLLSELLVSDKFSELLVSDKLVEKVNLAQARVNPGRGPE